MPGKRTSKNPFTIRPKIQRGLEGLKRLEGVAHFISLKINDLNYYYTLYPF